MKNLSKIIAVLILLATFIGCFYLFFPEVFSGASAAFRKLKFDEQESKETSAIRAKTPANHISKKTEAILKNREKKQVKTALPEAFMNKQQLDFTLTQVFAQVEIRNKNSLLRYEKVFNQKNIELCLALSWCAKQISTAPQKPKP